MTEQAVRDRVAAAEGDIDRYFDNELKIAGLYRPALVNAMLDVAEQLVTGHRAPGEQYEASIRALYMNVVGGALDARLERHHSRDGIEEAVELLYASQIDTAPPTLAIVSNRPDEVPESYQRYLAHGFREAWPFTGSPLRLKFTRRGSRR